MDEALLISAVAVCSSIGSVSDRLFDGLDALAYAAKRTCARGLERGLPKLNCFDLTLHGDEVSPDGCFVHRHVVVELSGKLFNGRHRCGARRCRLVMGNQLR